MTGSELLSLHILAAHETEIDARISDGLVESAHKRFDDNNGKSGKLNLYIAMEIANSSLILARAGNTDSSVELLMLSLRG